MKRSLVLSLIVVTGLAFAGLAGPLVGFHVDPVEALLVPVVGIQYEGQFGFGFGAEFWHAPFSITGWTWYGDYGAHGYVTLDMPNRYFIEVGVLPVVAVVDRDPGVALDVGWHGTFAVGLGELYGHSLRSECTVDFSTLRVATLSLGVRVDLFGLVRQACALFDSWTPDRESPPLVIEEFGGEV